jgi:hypothetical protein
MLASRRRGTKSPAAKLQRIKIACYCWLGSAALLIVDDHLRRSFAQFKLCAHFLDLRCLLFEVCS